MAKQKSHDDIVQLVKNLLDLADPARGASEGEVAAATERAQILIAKHNLDMAEVMEAQKEGDKPIWEYAQVTVMGGKKQHIASWERNLWHSVASLTGVHCITFNGVNRDTLRKQVKVVYVGDKVDCALAAALFDALMDSLHKLARKQNGTGWGRFHNAYASGFCDMISSRIYTIIREKNAEKEMSHSDQNRYALVLTSKSTWLETEKKKQMPNLANGKPTHAKSYTGTPQYYDGVRDAKDVSLEVRRSVK